MKKCDKILNKEAHQRSSASHRLASIPRGLRTPVTSAESRAEILTSNLHQIIRSRISKSISPFPPKLETFKLLRPAPMRRGRNVKSQGFIGLLTAASNRKPRSLSHLIIGRGSEPKGFL
ncbi:hypothetical protein AVEN_75645-1 [Araneus ventricosus]|uniref:Uncharacterized protein n=1 Tax=Araneus ventricosus TaxID=182803 RepID=A0A4Y2D6E1_ARAVE|nr:hypothetical protein AVEN_75645-1 [Araneus ventricosus]